MNTNTQLNMQLHHDHLLFISPFLASIALIASLYLFIRRFAKKVRYPPSPPKLPIIGNFHQLSSLPHRSLLALSNKYGPLMLLQLGQVPTLVVSSPNMAREIMKGQDHIFANRPSLHIPRKLLYQGKDIAFAPYNEYWRQVRKIGVLHLLSTKMVHSFKSIREEEVSFMIDKICEMCYKGEVINLTEILNTLAKDIISRAALGKCLKEEKRNDAVGKLIEEASTLLGAFHWGDYFPWLAWISKINGLDARVCSIFDKVDEFLDDIVDQRRALGFSGELENNESGAFVDILLSLEKDLNRSFPFDKQNIKAIIEDMFGAGTDSTYITMEWIMAELLRNPEVVKKLKQEIKNIVDSNPMVKEEHLDQMKYLKAVVKETLRLHPPGSIIVPRESMQDTEIQGYKISKHTRVLINAWAIGRDPNVWELPEKFWPERFIDSEIDFRGHHYELIPFGAGRRICPGIQFAMVIVELVVANLVHRFDWKLSFNMSEDDMDMEEAPGLTNRKNVNLYVTATPCV